MQFVIDNIEKTFSGDIRDTILKNVTSDFDIQGDIILANSKLNCIDFYGLTNTFRLISDAYTEGNDDDDTYYEKTVKVNGYTIVIIYGIAFIGLRYCTDPYHTYLHIKITNNTKLILLR